MLRMASDINRHSIQFKRSQHCMSHSESEAVFKHQSLNEQKISEHHAPNPKSASHAQNPRGELELPDYDNFRLKRTLFWVPVLFTLLIVGVAIFLEVSAHEQQQYCFRGSFTPTALAPGPERQVLVDTRYGFQLYVDREDSGVSKNIAEKGSHNPSLINLVGQSLSAGDHVLSVGSAVGLEAVIMGQTIGPTGKLFVTSPSEFTAELVRKNLVLNKIQNQTTIYPVQASNFKKTNMEQIDLGPAPDAKTANSETSFDLLDDLIPAEAKLNFAYINSTEQARAILGMARILGRSPTLLIVTEWQSAQQALMEDSYKEQQEALQLLAGRGYRAYQYRGGTYVGKCRLGRLTEIKDIKQLLSIRDEIVVFMPEGWKFPS